MRLRGASWLVPAEWAYRLALEARGVYYAVRPGASVRLPLPTVGVGNLSVGGTGKTSMVSYLLELLLPRGLRAAVLSRGYGRPRGGRGTLVVSRGAGPEVTWEEAGDEPFLLARRHPQAMVVVGKSRVEAGRRAANELGAEVLILDDAFQHWRVRRDLDLLMVDARDPPGGDYLLPRGRLREPVSAARRAHLVVSVGTPEAGALIPASEVGWARARYRPLGWWRSGNRGETCGPEDLGGRRAYLFSGIGNPRSFANTARSLGLRVVGEETFRDHHRYRPGELVRLERAALERGAEVILTTEKDEIRVPAREGERIPLWVLEVRLAFVEGERRLTELLNRAIGGDRENGGE